MITWRKQVLGSILVDLLRINGDEHCNDMCRVHCHFVISSDTADPVGLAWKEKKITPILPHGEHSEQRVNLGQHLLRLPGKHFLEKTRKTFRPHTCLKFEYRRHIMYPAFPLQRQRHV